MPERIMTLHPQGRQGVNIERVKYDAVRQAILAALAERGEIPFAELDSAVAARLPAGFAGSVGWYTTTVKLDLEARGLVERVPGRSPQLLRLHQAAS